MAATCSHCICPRHDRSWIRMNSVDGCVVASVNVLEKLGSLPRPSRPNFPWGSSGHLGKLGLSNEQGLFRPRVNHLTCNIFDNIQHMLRIYFARRSVLLCINFPRLRGWGLYNIYKVETANVQENQVKFC